MAIMKRSTVSMLSPLRPTSVPAGVMWVMVGYMVVDVTLHCLRSSDQFQIRVFNGLQDSMAKNSSSLVESADISTDVVPGCDSIEGHMNVESMMTPDPWKQMKWGLPPAACPVKGHLIERLDPDNNYRRGVGLSFTNDLDDKTQIEHWFLGTKVNLNKAKRRVLIDFGGNYFHTSVLWFLQRYPCDFTEVYTFEVDPNLFHLPEGFEEEQNWMDPSRHGWKKIKSRRGFIPTWMVPRIELFNKYAGDKDDDESVNVTRFIKQELKLTADDTVIVKMDIEGAEWPILERWVKDPEMPKIIDELFVELHYFHPDNQWKVMKPKNREDATRMLAELRYKGFYTHYWD